MVSSLAGTTTMDKDWANTTLGGGEDDTSYETHNVIRDGTVAARLGHLHHYTWVLATTTASTSASQPHSIRTPGLWAQDKARASASGMEWCLLLRAPAFGFSD